MAVSSHLSRWLVAVILLPIIVGIIYIRQPILFHLLVIIVGILALMEFYQLVIKTPPTALMAIGAASLALLVFAAGLGSPASHVYSFLIIFWAGAVYFLLSYDGESEDTTQLLHRLGWFASGHVYISLSLSFFAVIYRSSGGHLWVLLLLFVTFLADTGAFYAGKTFGKRSLYKAVSPNKTVEGLLGGLMAGGVTAAIFAAVFMSGVLIWYDALFIGILLGFGGAVGDLFESMIKRAAQVKDSGSLLKGHGGMLDRIDALLFNVPLLAAILTLWY